MISMKINHRCLVPFRVEIGKLMPKHKAVIKIVLLTTWVGSLKGLAVLGILYLIVKGRYKKSIKLSALPSCSWGRLEKKP